MKRIVLYSIGGIIAVSITVIIVAEIISFNIVKKTTDKINTDLNQKFQQIVRIPSVIPPSYRGYYQTRYNWEMETPQKEVIKVIFTHDTGFSKSQNKITATLSMEPNADASLFNKVLPAVISDNQTLTSAQHFENANLSANSVIGYKKIIMDPVEGDNTRMTKITWEFDRGELAKGEDGLYDKINKIPEPLLKVFYGIQQFTIKAFSG